MVEINDQSWVDFDDNNGRQIGDIVKEYPDMLKIVIYHNNYTLPAKRDPLQIKEDKRQKKENNIHRSLRRTKTTIQDIMYSNRFDIWATFTYNCRNCKPKCTNNPCVCSPSNCQRYDINYTYRTLRTWFRNQKRLHSPNLKYLAVPEFHENGAVHFHCMLSGFRGVMKDSGKKTKHNQTIYNVRGYYSGWTEFVKIGERFDSQSYDDDYNRVISYLTKYITKDMPRIYGRQRFLVSNELIRPITTVNGVSKLGLAGLIKNHKPTYINDYLEVQKHKKSGAVITSRNPQTELF